MKKIALVILLLANILLATTHSDTTGTTTIYRERMKSSVSTAMLIGVAGTYTAGDTCVGTYKYSFQMHSFPVQKSGYYTLWEDVLGGTAYVRRTDWSSTIGKYVPGGDMNSAYESSLHRYISASKSEPDSVVFHLGSVSPAPYTVGMIDINSPTALYIPPNITVSAERPTVYTSDANSIIDISATHDVFVYGGGTLYGKSDSTSKYKSQTEHDAGVEIKSSKNVYISGLNIKNTSGDGVTVGYIYFPTQNQVDTLYQFVESDGVKLTNLNIYTPQIKGWNWPINSQVGRNSISVTGGKNIIIDGCTLSGGNPAVIDIEGNASARDTVDNLIITNCIIDGLSKGRYTIGAVTSDKQFYLKGVRGMDLSIPEDSLVGLTIQTSEYGNVTTVFGGDTYSWHTISGNTATAGDSVIITVANAWATSPVGYYAVIYNHDADWPAQPDSSDLFGDAKVTSYSATSPYKFAVHGVTATLNQLANYRVYFTSNPIHGIRRHIVSNSVSVGDSVLVTLNDEFLDLTPVRGKYVGLGEGLGRGIYINGSARYRNIIISNNIIKNTYGDGIRIQQGGSDSTHKVIVSNNRLENCFNVAIEGAGVFDAKITDNHIYNSTLGINITSGDYNTITGNVIKSCTSGGIWILGGAGNDSTGTIEGTVISGNTAVECGMTKSYGYPNSSIWISWSKNSSVYGNSIVNSDTSTSEYQWAIRYNYCKDLYVGDNSIIGYSDNYWWGEGCTYRNTIFNRVKGIVGVNIEGTAYAFAVADTLGAANYTAMSNGVLYPNAANPKNKIWINGATLILEGDDVVTMSVKDTSGVKQDLVVASIDSLDNKTVAIHGGLFLPDIVKANTHDATSAGEFWVNTSHDTLWYTVNGTQAAYILIDGYVTKH